MARFGDSVKEPDAAVASEPAGLVANLELIRFHADI
jgi:hypothetical protein